jgi:hypothetical protein
LVTKSRLRDTNAPLEVDRSLGHPPYQAHLPLTH